MTEPGDLVTLGIVRTRDGLLTAVHVFATRERAEAWMEDRKVSASDVGAQLSIEPREVR